MRLCYLTFASIGLLLSGCSADENTDVAAARAASTPRAVGTAAVSYRPMVNDLRLSGVLVAREEAAVTSQLSGYPVAAVLADQDDQVRAGQPLVRLDDTLLRADIAQQRAVVAQQSIAAEKARAEAARVTGLEDSGVLSAEAIGERKLAARSADASAAQAQAVLRSLLVKQSLMTIRAPMGGRILSRAVRPGDMSAPGTIMFRIARGNLVEVDAEVPEQVIDQIRPGQRASVVLPSGVRLPGTVRLVSAEIDAQTKLGRARVLTEPDPALRPGGFADVQLRVAQSQSAAVPEASVSTDAAGSTVMVLDRHNRVHRTRVGLGARSGGWVALQSGPPVGSHILTGGQGFVLDGDEVKPVAAK